MGIGKQGEWNYKGLTEWLDNKFRLDIKINELKDKEINELEKWLIDKAHNMYEEKEKRLTANMMRKLEQYILLEKIDDKWKNHLYSMDHLRSGVGLRSYAQVDPKIEYKREGFQAFSNMIESIKDETTDLIFKVRLNEKAMDELDNVWNPTEFKHQEIGSFEGIGRDAQKGAMVTEKPKPVVIGEKVGRNDPCTCGSGKKYKKCCGMNA